MNKKFNDFELFEQAPDCKLTLNDGALHGLAKGANMTFVSSICELADNGKDANASEITLDFSREKEHNTLIIRYKEDTNLQKDEVNRLFNLGNPKKAQTKKNGIGKYNQGFKYACANLIGDNKGTVRVEVKPQNGEPWAVVQTIDYSNDEQYTDQNLYYVNPEYLNDEYSFIVVIQGAKMPNKNEKYELKWKLGLRYRSLLVSNEMQIKINDEPIKPIDRLYSLYGDRAGYKSPVYFPYKDNPKAFKWECSDLSETHFSENELCDYDNQHKQGVERGVAVTSRAGIELCVNGISIVEDGLLFELIGKQLQPSGSSWRGRLTLEDNRVVDDHITGGNKCKCVIQDSFITDPNTEEIRRAIKLSHSQYISEHIDEFKNKKYCSTIKALDALYQNKIVSTRFLFYYNDDTRELFCKDEANNTIEVNASHRIFKNKKEEDCAIFVWSIIRHCSNEDIKQIYKELNNFKNELLNNDLIN